MPRPGRGGAERGHRGGDGRSRARPGRYFRTAFRPVAAEQPEWAPIESSRLPESRALFDLIDERRPLLQCSLHGIEAGGTFTQLTENLPGFAEGFHTAAADLSVPVQHGTFDALYWENPAPGVHVLPPPESTGRLAAGSENIGRSTWCAPQRYGGVTAIAEAPMWASALADDPAPHPDAVRALHGLSRLVRDGGEQVTAVLDKARGFLPPPEESAPRRVLEWMAGACTTWSRTPGSRWPGRRPRAGERLTTAQVCALDVVARRQPLRAAGLLMRLLSASADPAAPALHDELHALFTAWCEDFTRALRLRWVPVRAQADLQARTVLAAAECAVRAAHR